MQVELWNKRNGKFPMSRGREEILHYLQYSLGETLLPGTQIEGEWVRKHATLYLFDITYLSFDPDRMQSVTPSAQDVRRGIIPATNGELNTYCVTKENESNLKVLEENKTLTRVDFVHEIPYHYPPNPCESSAEIVDLHPDDWRLELKLNGDRVQVIVQPEGSLMAIDLRKSQNEIRHGILEKLVGAMDNPQIKLMPYTDSNYHRFYREWQDLCPEAEGVVAKYRDAPYIAGRGRAMEVDTWRKRRFSWDD